MNKTHKWRVTDVALFFLLQPLSLASMPGATPSSNTPVPQLGEPRSTPPPVPTSPAPKPLPTQPVDGSRLSGDGVINLDDTSTDLAAPSKPTQGLLTQRQEVMQEISAALKRAEDARNQLRESLATLERDLSALSPQATLDPDSPTK